MSNDMHNRRHDPHPDDDVLLQQVRAALTPMPEVDRRAIARILTAVVHRQPTRVERLRAWWDHVTGRIGVATSPFARGVALAAAALTIGFVARGALPSRNGTIPARVANAAPDATVPTQTSPALQPVEGAAERAELRVPVQFVLDAREAAGATTLHVVGDFNDWDVSATPMSLEQGVWSASLPITPGRHVYAFVVDGARWIADPRTPQTKDADFGRPMSVVIVQAP